MTVTLLTAGACGLIAFILAFRVSAVRRSARVSLGDGGNEALLGRIRAHANFSEYVPLLLVLIGVIELKAGSTPSVAVAGVALILGRIAHAIGMGLPAPNPWRIAGTATTWLLLAALGVWAIVLAF